MSRSNIVRAAAGVALSACMLLLFISVHGAVARAVFGVGLLAGLTMVAAAIRDHRTGRHGSG